MGKRHVAPAVPDIGEHFKKWKAMLNVPHQVGKEYQERQQSSQPDPWFEEHGTLMGKQQAGDDAGRKENDAILIFQRYAAYQAEPEPQFLIARFDDPNQNQRAS